VKRRFAVAMARRELRGAHRRLLLFGLAMALGVAGIVALQAMRAAVAEAVAERSQRLLGADLRLESHAPFEGDAGALLADVEARAEGPAARVTRFGAMALAPASGRTRLVDVYGVDPAYPLYGEPETDPPGAWPALQGDEPVAFVVGAIEIGATVRAMTGRAVVDVVAAVA